MGKNTSYTVQEVDADGTTTDVGDAVSRLDKAKDLAQARFDELGGSTKVQVVTQSGNVSLELEPTDLDAEAEELVADATVAGAAVPTATSKRSKPWTRVDQADYAPERAGYTLAYTRKRTGVAIYRADDKSGWLILDTRDGSEYTSVNTEEGRQITNRLTAEHNEAVKAQREAEAKERAAARQAKKEAAAEAKAAAAQAKAEAAAAKAAAAVVAEVTEDEDANDGANA